MANTPNDAASGSRSAVNWEATQQAPTGQGTLRFFGLQVYHARLWTGPGFQADRLGEAPLQLELEYLRNFKGADIARRSIEEMRRIGPFDDAQARRWQTQMAELFPDVRTGDRLTGILRPGLGAEFRWNGRAVGEIRDPQFARLFFGIWLAPSTSEPGLRESLLGTALQGAR